jgi:hypothetical protein
VRGTEIRWPRNIDQRFARTDVGLDEFGSDDVLTHERSSDSTTHKLVSDEVLDQREDISTKIRKSDETLG